MAAKATLELHVSELTQKLKDAIAKAGNAEEAAAELEASLKAAEVRRPVNKYHFSCFLQCYLCHLHVLIRQY